MRGQSTTGCGALPVRQARTARSPLKPTPLSTSTPAVASLVGGLALLAHEPKGAACPHVPFRLDPGRVARAVTLIATYHEQICRSPARAGNHCRSAFAILLSPVFRAWNPKSQLLGPDPFLPRARDARGRLAKGSHLGNRDMAKSNSDKAMLAARADTDSFFKKQSAGRARG